MSRPAVESTLFRARRRLTEEYDDIVSGARCLRIQDIIVTAAQSRLGTRDTRRLARHLSHCQGCRREALAAGLDRELLTRPSVRERRLPRRGAAAVPGVREVPRARRRRPLAPGAARRASQLPMFSDHCPAGWGKAAAGAAILAAGVGAGAGVHQVATPSAAADRPAEVRTASAADKPVAAKKASAPWRARSCRRPAAPPARRSEKGSRAEPQARQAVARQEGPGAARRRTRVRETPPRAPRQAATSRRSPRPRTRTRPPRASLQEGQSSSREPPTKKPGGGGGGSLPTTVPPVDETVQQTTGALDDTVDKTTDTLDQTVQGATDGVDRVVDGVTGGGPAGGRRGRCHRRRRRHRRGRRPGPRRHRRRRHRSTRRPRRSAGRLDC